MKSKWSIAAAGMGLMMVLGSIYSWSVFTEPLMAAYGWSNSAATAPFALAIAALGLGALAGGRWQARVGPRPVAVASAILWGGGNMIAGLGLPSLGHWWLCLAYGAIGGFGVGMGYVCSVSAAAQWFHARRGLGTGLVVMGFVMGTLAYSFALKSVPSFASIASAAAALPHGGRLPASMASSLASLFVWSGAAFLALGLACACALSRASAEDAATESGEDVDYTPREMLREPSFYMQWAMLFANVTAGILLIGNALPIMAELAMNPPSELAAAWGLLALANVAGRFLWPALSDAIGARSCCAALYAVQIAAFCLLGFGGLSSLWAVSAAFAVVLLCYGGGFGVMPSFNAEYFGARHISANYGIMLTSWGAAGLAGPAISSWSKDATGSFLASMPIAAGLLAAALLLPLLIRKPSKASAASASVPGELADQAPEQPSDA